MYAGVGGWLKKGTPDEVATQTAIYTRKGSTLHPLGLRVHPQAEQEKAAYAGGQDQRPDLRPRPLVADFPGRCQGVSDIKPDYNHVDACCMWMVKNPEFFDVIVTTNMFGDIITDLAGILQGGMGVAAGGNINPEPAG